MAQMNVQNADMTLQLMKMEGARQALNHLHFQPDFVERTLSALFSGLEIPKESEKPVEKEKKTKRIYKKSAQGNAWTEFAKAHRAEITTQVKSEGFEPKKVSGEVGKRLGALWKEAKENPKSGSNSPSENESGEENTE